MSARFRHTPHSQDGIEFDGALISDGASFRPGVLVIHGWEGRSQAQEEVAARLADWGYSAFCVDLYGNARRGSNPEECAALMAPLMADRVLLRHRLLGAVRAASALKEIDSTHLAAIGFCFGGLCVLDLARMNAPLRAVASFHGVLTPPAYERAQRIDPKIIVFHGWDDPMAPPADVLALATELTTMRADWQLHAYGATMHAFMAEGVDAPQSGLQYNARSARRAWTTLQSYLAESLTDS